MILGAPSTETVPGTTLDDLFRRNVQRRPDTVALADPPNRLSFTDGAPRRLSYAEADRIVSGIAARLRDLGLSSDAIIGIQLPNTVEAVLTLLAILRAGMIAAPLPLLWRRAEAVDALGRLGAKAIVTTSRFGGHDAAAMAMQVAADVFSIRHVCAFGQNLPDGVVALDDLTHQAPFDSAFDIERDNPADNVALVTFEVTPHGTIAVARNHAELIAGVLEGGVGPDARILSSCATGSFAGLALTVMPWLLSGGTLSLHHGFDADAFAAQCRNDGCDTVVVPGALVPQLAEAGALGHAELKNVLGVWRSPERLAASPSWRHPAAKLTDIHVFGETALVGMRRDADGLPAPLPVHTVLAPSGSASAVRVLDLARTESGTLAVRGAMVPRHAFPPGAELGSAPHLKPDAQGYVDTFYPCRVDRMAATTTITGPPPGIVSVGGYRFVLSDLNETVQRAGPTAVVIALPDAFAGHRLAGISGGSDIRRALTSLGVNALLAAAFRDGPRQAASAVDEVLMAGG